MRHSFEHGAWLWVLLLGCASSIPAVSATPPAASECIEPAMVPLESSPASATKREDILRLLKVTNFDAMVKASMDQTTSVLRSAYPDLPQNFYDTLTVNFSASFVREVTIPIYDKHYTHEEIVAMINFYSTPLGQSVIAKAPTVMGESMQQGADWGRLFAERAVHHWYASRKQAGE